jgi:outer membrane protein
MGEEFQAKLKKYEAEAATVSEKINGERQKEVQDMEKRIQEFAQTAQKELQTKEGDLMKPIEEKIKAAIQKVGKAKGYQYVMNSAGLLLADGPNLTADIKKELGF